MHVLRKLHASFSYSAADCEFNVNESKIYIKENVFKQKYTSNKDLYWLVSENVVTRGSQELTLVFPAGNNNSLL
jgi:hypothetical protein